jgi:large subunit ribosomal protein L6
MPVPLPSGVTVDVKGATLSVKGPKGTLTWECPPGVRLNRADGKLLLEREAESGQHRALHGLSRKLVANMVHGVVVGFTRVLEINGVGYRAEAKDKAVHLTLGFSHPVVFPLPPGITARVEKQTILTLEGADRQLLGRTAAAIRALRKCEPYKAKGIKYSDEVVRRKAGKAAAGAK